MQHIISVSHVIYLDFSSVKVDFIIIYLYYVLKY